MATSLATPRFLLAMTAVAVAGSLLLGFPKQQAPAPAKRATPSTSAVTEPPRSEPSCPARVALAFRSCLESQQHVGRSSVARAAFETCASLDHAARAFDALCEADDAPSFCADGVERFAREPFASCAQELGANPTHLELFSAPTDDAIRSAAEAVAGCATCELNLRTFRYSRAQPAPKPLVLSGVREHLAYPEAYDVVAAPNAALTAHGFGELIETGKAWAGSDEIEVGKLEAAYLSPLNRPINADAYVLHFPREGLVVAVERLSQGF